MSQLHHQATSNDHVISNALFSFVVINMKAVRYYPATRNIWHTKWQLDGMRHTIQSCDCSIFHPIGMHIALVRLSLLHFNQFLVRSDIPHTCQPFNYCCPMFLIFQILSSFFNRKQCIYTMKVCPNLWPSLWYRPPAHLDRYQINCLNICILNDQCLNVLTFQPVAKPGCYVNIVEECKPLRLLVVIPIPLFVFCLFHPLPK